MHLYIVYIHFIFVEKSITKSIFLIDFTVLNQYNAISALKYSTERVIELASWKSLYIHDQFIEVNTGKAILIKLPKLIDSIKWGIWVPNKLVRKPIEKYRKQLTYPENFKFNAAPLDIQNDERRVLTEQEILNQFNSVDMTEIDVELDLNLYIEKLKQTINLFRSHLIEIQAINGCPETIDNLIKEVDIEDIDIFIENIELAKNRWFIS